MSATAPDALEALRRLLAAEHAAVYGYGVLGARLSDALREQARAATDAHRAHRDSLQARLRERSAVFPAPPAAFDVRADDVEAALALAVRLEEGLASRWLALVLSTDDPALRGAAVSALQSATVRAVSWRRAGGVVPSARAFPGEP